MWDHVLVVHMFKYNKGQNYNEMEAHDSSVKAFACASKCVKNASASTYVCARLLSNNMHPLD